MSADYVGPEYDRMDDASKAIVNEVAARALDLIKANPELGFVSAEVVAMIYQAGVVAGFDACLEALVRRGAAG